MVDRRALAEDIRTVRAALVSALSGIDPDGWNVGSLCDGWSVRDVVSHLVRVYHYGRSPVRFAAGMAAAGLRPNRYMAADARRWAAGRDPRELVGALAGATHEDTWIWRHHPAPEMTLGELVIHGLDIKRPLGLPDGLRSDHLRAVADLAVRDVPRVLRYPLGGWERPAVRFEATDHDWAWGRGTIARGPLASILLVLAGRRQAVADLDGDGVAVL